MGVVGVFSLVRERRNWDDFVPLVYVAVAPDAAAAQEIHRLVWSQGLIPYLLIALPTEVRCCNGLSFSSSNWARDTPAVSLDQLAATMGRGLPPELIHLTARSLRTSIVWNDGSTADSRVDKILLKSLRHLIDSITEGRGEIRPKLPRSLANALVGRFLYLRCLKERRVLPTRGVPLLHDGASHPTIAMMWETFEKLESVFNGSIFPIADRDRRLVTKPHLDLLSEVLLNGGAFAGGHLQHSFRDFNFSVIRTETLSAVYQMFLKADDSTEDQTDGAFYTPPFLVDYVLSKIERIEPIGDGQIVFDCAAGSGLFLVGAFRRLVETKMRHADAATLPLSELRGLLTSAIWGIERNPDACHIAALSLYLTMLDYVSREEIEAILARGRPTIFPTLVDRNLLARDFFDCTQLPRHFPRAFDVIAANPPWDPVSELGGDAEAYASGPRGDAIDHGRTAGLFFWKAWDQHLGPGGRFGFLLHSKTLLSTGADKFPAHLLSERVAITDIVNLTHMRRKLFQEAEAGAILLCGTKHQASPQHRFRVFAPLSASQPVANDGRPWAIVEDSASVEEFSLSRMTKVGDLIEAVSLRPIDRALLEWLRSQCRAGNAASFRETVRHHGFVQTRGASPNDTKIPAAHILNARNYRTLLDLSGGTLVPSGYSLPPKVLENAAPGYRRRFGGNVLLIPRSKAPVVFVERSFAFNSSFNVVHSASGAPSDAIVLRALASYLNSDFARYCYSLIGRDWRVDERRFEADEMRDIPVPAALLDSDYARRFLKMSKANAEAAILEAFDLPRAMRVAVSEYESFRAGFHNSQVPDEAFHHPSAEQLRLYERVITEEFTGGMASMPLSVRVVPGDEWPIAALLVEYGNLSSRGGQVAAAAALAEMGSGWRDLLHDSGAPVYDSDSDSLVMLKPWFRLHWTVERAYVDARRLVSEAMIAGIRSKRGSN
jgi:hypothetical protein